MARNAFGPIQDDEQLDAQALMAQLKHGSDVDARGEKTPMSFSATPGAPTSNTMPVNGRPTPIAEGFTDLSTPGTKTPVTPGAGGPPPARFTPTPGARYDQWSGQGNVGTTGSDFGRMEGFDATNWNDPNMQTAKYQAGRIFGRFDPNSPNALAAMMADQEFRALFPKARALGPDKIDFGDGQPIDVIRGYGAPGAGWAWQVPSGVTSASSGTGSLGRAGASTGGGPSLGGNFQDLSRAKTGTADPTTTEDPMAAIIAEIQALQNGDSTPMDQTALMQLLGI